MIAMKARISSASRRTLLLGAVVAGSLAVFAAAPGTAGASGGFGVFANCPISNPEVVACVVATASGGEFTVGNKTVPVKRPVTLQGGIAVNAESGATTFVGATNGETLSKTAETVPGGLLGIEGLGGEVTATTELAGPASGIALNTENLLTGQGTALSLPVKLKLGNPFLGNNCYGGSNRNPIVLNMTTGTTSPPPPNKPITGSPGTLEGEEEGLIGVLDNDSLVNNSFAAPGVQGCGLVPLLVDPLVDLSMGVPAPAGHNTAILKGQIRLASAFEVKAHS
jgi:hypothetical protein